MTCSPLLRRLRAALHTGVSTFQEKLRGRKVVIWSDNSGAEYATRKGTRHPRYLLHRRMCFAFSLLAGATKRFDHCCIVHALWEHFMKLNMNVWVDRVPTKENIADNPSRFFKALCFALFACVARFACRESYEILRNLGATRVEGKLAPIYRNVGTWEALFNSDREPEGSRPETDAIDLVSE